MRGVFVFTETSFREKRVAKLSVASMMTSDFFASSIKLFSVNFSPIQLILISGLSESRCSFAESILGRLISLVACNICRCKLLRSTLSKSTSTNSPIPAAARYIETGEPSPPSPISKILELFKRF